MSDIICQWLNEELRLSMHVDPKGLAKEFATGYLIGEVLHKYQLQEDFDQFSQSRAANSKLNNFTRVEPTLKLLGIPFDQNVAQNIMSEQHGAATRLLYQLYIALQKKKKAGLTGVALETLRAAAPAKLQRIGSEIYREQMKTLVPRQTDLDLQQVSEQFELIAKEMDEKMAQIQNGEIIKMQKIQEELRMQDIEKLRQARRRQNEIMARIQAAVVQIPKPPPNRTLRAIQAQKILRKKKEAEEVYQELARFEYSMKKDAMISSITPNGRSPTLQRIKSNGSIGGGVFKLESNDDYLRKIQKRLEEDTTAREQREKRRRRVLMEQLVAHGAQEESFREEQLINRLMKQSQQERRIAVQLMHTRHEKEIIGQNRIFREKQYQERREREFQEVLDREAALQHQAKLDAEEQMRNVQELHDQIAAERVQARYKKHYGICQEIVNQIVDLVTKTGEYRELTNRLIPNKVMREWKQIFMSGLPLYEEASIDPLPSEPTPEQLVELEKENLLNDKDFEEYQTMSGEWILSDDSGVKTSVPNNNILGHVVHRLLDIVNPPPANTPPPAFPPFPIKGCILGKIFSGKSNCLKHLAKAFSFHVLCVDTLVKEAVQAYENNEMEQENSVPAAIVQEEPQENKQMTDNVPAESSGPEVHSAESIPAITDEPINETTRPIVQSSTKENSVQKENKLSARAELGGSVEKYLKKGKAVPDELLVDILVTAINHIPANSGWVIDGFPATLNQAKLVEKALTGYDPDKMATRNKKKMSTLVKDLGAPQDPPPPPPSLDFAALIEVSDNVVLQRAAGSRGQGDDQYNETAPKGDDHDQKLNQIQHRITGFLDNWPKLEAWFSLQNILVKVDGEVDKDSLYHIMENAFLTALYYKQNKDIETEKKEEIQPLPVTPPAPSLPPTPPPESTKDPRPPSPGKRTSAKKGKGKSKSPKDSSLDKKEKKKDTPRGKDSGRKSPKTGSPRRGRSPGKKNKSVPTTPEPTALTPVGPPPIQPGSAQWVYVNEPLPKEIPEFLVPYWETIEKTYEAATKAGLKSMRQERFIVIHYLYDIRIKFKDYLKRPDHKQEFVSQWQSDFNSIPEDMWEDEETKAEMHQRLDDLRDRLWDICDNRKEEAEQEQADIMNDGWLQDHLGILMNHFFSLMQAEIDRFQDTMRFLHDYYQGMENKIPSENNQEFVRIPLLEITNSTKEEEPVLPKRIALVPRKTQSPEPSSAKQRNKQVAMKGKEDASNESSGQMSETDQKIIHDTWQTALSTITNMVTLEKEALEAEEEKKRQMMEIREKERLKTSRATSRDNIKGAKKKPPKSKSPKSKSPNRKKGGKSPGPATPSPTPAAPVDNTELQRQQELQMKMKQEYFAALECEEAAVNAQLELIKTKALEVYQDMLSKAQQAYIDINMWLGARFLAEMSSIEKLIQVARHHIETSTKIQYELILEQKDFYISSDVKIFPDPDPPPRPPPVEMSINGTLTISQLQRLHHQFLQMAPEGIIPYRTFTEILMDLTSINLGDDTVPELWTHLTLPEIHEITSALSLDSDMANWRKFLLLASLPWPYPSLLQLLETLQRFQATDADTCGTINEDTYSQVELWFTGKTEEIVPENPTEPLPFNRPEHLIKFFFDLFANQKTQPAQLHYVDMLLYFASHPDPTEGFYRALSVVIGKPIVINTVDNSLVKSVPNMGIFEDGNGIISNEEDLLKNTEEVTVTVQEVLQVLEHGNVYDGESHRFHSREKQTSSYYTCDDAVHVNVNKVTASLRTINCQENF
ncbi:PREDICTED: sperm flagellar protein 2 [Nanorana parkeri]|uniref:sperm flagellar protein 2 n=1 Tax=Nanorana parkeri TaxID=125878 RepID=UPI000854758F|nr:PREDICTED: sperm flagellar protein 2 [Nanorana parkeri]